MSVSIMNESIYTMQGGKERESIGYIKLLVAEVYSSEFKFSKEFHLAGFIGSRISISYEEADSHFIRHERTTIEHYAMHIRLNKVKELLVYADISLDLIANKLNYNSRQDMADELLLQTGLPVEFFRKMKQRKESMVLRQILKNSN